MRSLKVEYKAREELDSSNMDPDNAWYEGDIT